MTPRPLTTAPRSEAFPRSLWSRSRVPSGVLSAILTGSPATVRGDDLVAVTSLPINKNTTDSEVALWDPKAFFLTVHALGSAGGAPKGSATLTSKDRSPVFADYVARRSGSHGYSEQCASDLVNYVR